MARRSYRSLLWKTVAILVVGVVLGVVARKAVIARRPKVEIAKIDLAIGDRADAEKKLWSLLQTEPPTLERFILFLDAHVLVAEPRRSAFEKPNDDLHPNEPARHDDAPTPSVTEGEIDAFLARPDLPDDFVHLARYARDSRSGSVDADLSHWIVAAADHDPPVAWANRLLAEDAAANADTTSMAERLMREGRFVPEHHRDIAAALTIYQGEENWGAISDALRDPIVDAEASPPLKARVAAEANDWGSAVRWSFHTTYAKPPLGPLLLAIIAALAWGVFCTHLGKARERWFFRISVYFAAFALGVMSVEITDLLILVEETKLHLVESGEPVRDFLFYTFGVGFREEISKLLLFAPLLPILLKHGKKVDVLVAGAFVGLGFAAVENVLYLQSGDLTTAIGRFLTANFLHMAMTAILANALHEYMVKGDDYAPEMSRTALMVMGMHGLYDFFIAHPRIGGGYLSMMVFFLLVNRFIVAIDMARGRSEPDGKLLDTFVLGIAVVLSAGYVWASMLVGPQQAAIASAEGLLGSAILMVVFAQRFRSM